MKLPKYTKEETCKMFGCTMQQLRNQYLSNAQSLEKMHTKAILTGTKVNGYTSEQLEKLTKQFYILALN